MDDVQNDLKQGTFDLDAFVQGRGFPTDTITVFTNDGAAHDLAKVEARLTEIGQNKNQKAFKEEFAALEKEAEDLKDAIKASALVFHMRGISPGHIKKVSRDVMETQKKEEWDEDYAADQLNFRWTAPHIIEVVNAAGESDKRVFTPERVENLASMLPSSEWQKIVEAINNLSFRTAAFDQAADAGFLPKS